MRKAKEMHTALPRVAPFLFILLNLTIHNVCPLYASEIDTASLASKSRPAIVKIDAYNMWKKRIGTGTGFFVSSEGLLVTCAHIIRGAHHLEVRLFSGSVFDDPELVAADSDIDLALLRVDGRNLPYLPLGTSRNVRVGDSVMVIGSSLGDLEGTVSDGIISNVWEEAGSRILQTTAPISPGNSGGPLIAADGLVVGIVSSQRVEGQNINFAIPAEYLHSFVSSDTDGSESEVDVGQSAQYSYVIGTLSWDVGALNVAEASFHDAIRLDPTHVSSYVSLADVYYEKGDFQRQTNILQEALRHVPEDASLHHNLGLAYEGLGLEDEAITEYRKAISINPEHLDAFYNLAFLYILRSSFDEASVIIEQLRPLQPRYAQQLARLIGMLQVRSSTPKKKRWFW